MKPIKSVFPILSGIVLFISTGCSLQPSNKQFVSIEGKEFKLGDTTFFPLILNYSTTMIRDSFGELVLSPFKSYEISNQFEHFTKKEIHHQILGHMKIICQMGFNTVRLCLDNDFFQNVEKDEFLIRIFKSNDDIFRVDALEITQPFLKTLRDFIDIVKSQDLKLIVMISPPFSTKAKKFTKKLIHHFSQEPAIIAYDFFNEPLYFHKKYLGNNHQNKQFPIKITREWKRMMRQYAPKQLFTIAFAEPIDVLHWDPTLVEVDFVQVHTYHPLRVPSELFWFTHYVNKPIVIGETSLPADNDSIYYEEQRQFMLESFQIARSWGICGYGWWTFQEVNHGIFEHDYTGIINRVGTTTTLDGKHTIIGTLKPAAAEVRNLMSLPKLPPFPRPVNYFNMLGYENYITCGKIVDENGNPIEGAVIRGWNEYWVVGMNTYSDEQGNFALYSNDKPVYFKISAPGKDVVARSVNLTYSPVRKNIEPEEKFPNRTLEYHSISFQPFLKYRIADKYEKIDSDNYIFNFDSAKFNNYRMKADLGTIVLEPIK